MPTLEIMLEFESKSTKKFELETVKIDNVLLNEYIIDFANKYATKNSWYRLGDISGNVILHNITFMSIRKLMEELNSSSRLREHILENNPQIQQKYTNNFKKIWVWIYRYIMNNNHSEIIEIISQRTNKTHFERKSFLDNNVQFYKGKNVVFYTFNDDWFAIPIEVAQKIYIEDYHGYRLGRDSDILNGFDDAFSFLRR